MVPFAKVTCVAFGGLVAICLAQPSSLRNPKPVSPAAEDQEVQQVAQAKEADFPSQPQPAQPTTKEQDVLRSVNQGYFDLAQAIRSLNPSYAIAPVIGDHAASAGSYYIRGSGTALAARYPASRAVVPASNPAAPATTRRVIQTDGRVYVTPARVALPPPLILSRYQLPWWLYSGTVDLEMDGVAVPLSTTDELRELREEVIRLRKQVEMLQLDNRK